MGFDTNKKHLTGTTVLGPIEVGGDYIYIRDEKASGTDGGTFTAGDWRTRDLNTIVQDDTGDVSLSSNQFTLPVGKYRINASAPFYRAGRNRIRLRNITDSSTTLIGTNEWGGSTPDQVSRSFLFGEFTITASKTFELQHQGDLTRATNGFGVTASQGIAEVYAVVQLIKIA